MFKKIILLTSFLCLPIVSHAQEKYSISILQTLSHTNNLVDNHFIENIQKINVDKDDYDSFNIAVNKLIDSYELASKYTFSKEERQLILLAIFAQKDSQHHCLFYKDNVFKISSGVNQKWPEKSECIKTYNQDSFNDVNSASYIINMNDIIKPLQDKANDNVIDNFVKKVVINKGSK